MLILGRCSNRSRCLEGDSNLEPYVVGHNVLLAHAHAVELYRTKYGASQGGSIGITLNSDWSEPLSAQWQDVQAAERRMQFQLGWFADPIFTGDYPSIIRTLVGDRLPVFTKDQKTLLVGSYDFFGLNHYSTSYGYHVENVSGIGWLADQQAASTYVRGGVIIGPKADSDWLYVVPWGFGRLLRYISDRYNNPIIYVTENGVDVPNESALDLDKALNDTFRIQYYHSYLRQLATAIHQGVRVAGYFAWSLFDNFEWADGYSKRFGLNYIDYNNDLQRYPKASSDWLAKLINITAK